MLSSNSYFDNQVQSVAFSRNERKQTVGVIAPGSYHFATQAAERMSLISGEAQVKFDGAEQWLHYPQGSSFEVKADSGFDIRCAQATAYWCEYL